ncbi:MAG: hypothetical protein ACI4XC_08855 [Eubacterium sp.]
MKREIRFQLINAFSSTGFIAMCVFTTVFAVICFVISCISVYGDDIISVPAAYAQFFGNAHSNEWFVIIFSMILPFVSCCAFADSYVSDYERNYISICITRVGVKNYYFSKLIAVFICGVFVVFLPQIINYLMCLIAFPIESTYEYTWDLWQADTYTYVISESYFLFKRLYIFSPYLYFFTYIIISSIAAGIIAVIGYQASFFVRNKIFVWSFMFIAINLLSILFEGYCIPMKLDDYIFGFSVGNMTYGYMALTMGIYILLSVIPIPFALRRLKNCI